MRNLLVGSGFVVLLFLSPLQIQLSSQTASIRGKVQDQSRKALSGAIVQIKALKKGTVSKADGSYVIDDLPAGKHIVEYSLLSYKAESRVVEIKDGEDKSIDVRLNAAQLSLPTVEVTASRRKQEQSDTRTSVVTVEPREAKFKAGAVEDVFRTLQTLPGVVAPSDFSSQLVIRGSGPDQNLILMDNVELFNPYRLYGFISLFNPETVSGISLLTGGFPAQYSDRLSAVLTVNNRDGATNRGYFGAKLNMSLTNVNVVTEGALPFLDASWIVSARRTYYDLIAGPIAKASGAVDGDVALPNFRDVQAKFSFTPFSSHRVFVNGLTSRDNTEFTSGVNRQQADSVSIIDNSYNDVLGATWIWSPLSNYQSTFCISYYKNEGSTSFGGQGGSTVVVGSDDPISREQFVRFQDSLRKEGKDFPSLFSVSGKTGFNFKKTSLKSEHSWKPDSSNTVEFGLLHDWIYTGVVVNFDFDPRLKALQRSNPRFPPLPESFENGADYIRSSAYVQDNFKLNRDLTIQPGLRLDYFALIGKTYLSPRLSASYALSPATTVRAAWGRYVQSPGYEKLFDASLFLDLTSNNVQDLTTETAMHYILGVEHNLSDEWQLRTELYYKRFSDLILPKRVQGTVWSVQRIPGLSDSLYRSRSGWTDPIARVGDSLTTIPVNSASGESYGIELLLQKIVNVGENKLYGWASYTFAFANRYRDGLTIPFNFDRRHNFNVVGGYKAAEWLDISFTFVYGTGFPWTQAKGIKPRIVTIADTINGGLKALIDTDWRGVIFDVDRGSLDNVNQGRLPDYHRLDLRFTTYSKWFGWQWSYYLDVINVYNHSNIVSEQYRVDKSTLELKTRQQSMLPIVPTLGFSVQF